MPRNYEKNKPSPVMLNRSQIRVVLLAIKSRLAATVDAAAAAAPRPAEFWPRARTSRGRQVREPRLGSSGTRPRVCAESQRTDIDRAPVGRSHVEQRPLRSGGSLCSLRFCAGSASDEPIYCTKRASDFERRKRPTIDARWPTEQAHRPSRENSTCANVAQTTPTKTRTGHGE